ncbi:MAG: hydrogenase/urease maturation nickel metallochaperone HypA [Elusimicrobiota bacterium]
MKKITISRPCADFRFFCVAIFYLSPEHRAPIYELGEKMHEAGLIEDLFKVVEEKIAGNPIEQVSKIFVQVSVWGDIKADHLRHHFDCFVQCTPWQNVVLEIIEVPSGPPLALSSIELK